MVRSGGEGDKQTPNVTLYVCNATRYGVHMLCVLLVHHGIPCERNYRKRSRSNYELSRPGPNYNFSPAVRGPRASVRGLWVPRGRGRRMD